MKKIICFGLAWKLMLLFSTDLFGQEKPKVTVEVNYLGGDLKTQFEYPKATSPSTSGKLHDVTGLQAGVVVAINSRVSVGGRIEENFLRRPRFVHEDRFGKGAGPDTNMKSSGSQYQEVYTSVALPKTGGHRLIAGAARTEFGQEWEFTVCPCSPPPSVGISEVPEIPQFRINSRDSITAMGPMVGIGGGKSFGRLGLNWSGRVYPRMMRTDRNSTVAEIMREQSVENKWSSASHGFELRGGVSYKLANHIALTGGYQHRQFYRPDPNPSAEWVANENQTERGFLGGLKFTF